MFTQAKAVVAANTPTPEKTNVQRVNDKVRRQASTRVLTALAGKQKEPNRGQGTERHPTSPRAHITGPNEGVEMYSQLEEGAKNKISPHEAGEILDSHGGRNADFHAISRDHVEGLLAHAKRVGYHKSKHAPGSRARMFHQFLKRHSSKVHEEVVEIGVVFLEGLSLWKFNKITGYWKHERSVTPETKDQWHKIHQEDEPHEHFHVSPYKPKHNPVTGKKFNEGRESEYTANQHLSVSKREPGHYLMKHGKALHTEPHATSTAALEAYKKIHNTIGISIHQVKENDEVVPGSVKTLSELKKSTLSSYITKSMRHLDKKLNKSDITDRKDINRRTGINRAQSRKWHGTTYGNEKPHIKEAIHNPNSSGQGHDSDHESHPLHATVVKHGYKYSHSTPIRTASGSTYIQHTYKHGEHNVGLSHSNIWDTSTSTSSGHHHAGKGAPELEAHLKSKGRRYGLKKEDTPAMSSGGGGDPGHVQNATDNYAAKLERRKTAVKNLLRRKKPVGESVLCGHVPPEVAGVNVGVISPEELKKNKELAQLPKKVGPGGVDKQ